MSVGAVVLFVVFFVLLVLRTPIAIALGLACFVYFYVFTTIGLTQIPATLFGALNEFPLVAVPLFILAANIMTTGGISRRLTDAARAAVGRMPGGLAVAAVLSCMFFAAVSGSSSATVVAVGALLIPAMTEAGYGKRFSTGTIATAGSMGILIPPSIPLVIYGVSTEQNIGDLFIAGVVPGVFAGLLMIVLVVGISYYRGLGRESLSVEAVERTFGTFRRALWGLALPFIILGGIYTGAFTPTEAAAVAVFYSLVVSMFVYRDMNISSLPSIMIDSAKTSAMIMFIIANGSLFAFVLASERIPDQLTNLILGFDLSAWGFLAVVMILLLIVGCFIETSSAVLILAPILLPVALGLDINPIHFGIVMIMALEIGLVTPPLGLNLFVASGISKLSILDIARAAIPTALMLLLALIVVTYVPGLSLFLVNE